MIDLYPDQIKSIDEVSEQFRLGNRNVLLQGATGSGKSIIGSEILRRVRARGKKAWFSVPRRALIHQMHEAFTEFGIQHSYIASQMSYNPHSPAHICSTETLRRRLDKLQPPDFAMIDETHFGDGGLEMIIKWLKEHNVWILGLSATPWKLSGMGLKCWYDVMVCGPSVAELIALGRLSAYRPFSPSTVDLSRISIVGGDYNKGQINQKMEGDSVLIGNAVKHYKEHAYGKRHIAYCVSIKHSELTAESFREQGIPAAHIDGETPELEQKRIIRAYANKEILVLTNNELLTFGFDLASQVGRDVTIESMSDMRPTKSLALQMQKWGRVLRRKNEPALIFDHANNFNEHGYPCDERAWTLEDRVQSRSGGERASPTRTCPKCFYCHRPAPVCPNDACSYLLTNGFRYVYPVDSREIEEVEGELKEIRIERERVEKKSKRMEVGMAKTMDDLRSIAKDRGYHWKWIEKQAELKGIKA